MMQNRVDLQFKIRLQTSFLNLKSIKIFIRVPVRIRQEVTTVVIKTFCSLWI
jgi:hypothetical protein